MKEENYECQESFEVEKAKLFFMDKALTLKTNIDVTQDLILLEQLNLQYGKIKTTVDDLNDYDAILYHKYVARCQRLAYNKHCNNIEELQNKILIELDFKQKIVIGLSPRQVSKEYYNQQAASCLGKFIFKEFIYLFKFKNFRILRLWGILCRF